MRKPITGSPCSTATKRNIRFFLAVVCAYLLFGLVGSCLCGVCGEKNRFFGSASVCAWILWNAETRVLLPMLLSAVPALFGKYCYSLAALFGFFIGIPLGEFFGEVPSKLSPDRCGGHYEVFTWFGIFLFSAAMGVLLEWLVQRNASRKQYCLWCAGFLFGIVAIIGCVHFA